MVGPVPAPDASASVSGEAAGPGLRRAVESGLLPVVVVHGAPPKPLAERMEHFAVPGVSVAVVREKKVAWAGAYGVKDASAPGAVSPETLFQAGSLSKPVTAVAAMRMVQDGELALDDDITERRCGARRCPARR